MAKEKDRKPLKRRQLKNWLPRKDRDRREETADFTGEPVRAGQAPAYTAPDYSAPDFDEPEDWERQATVRWQAGRKNGSGSPSGEEAAQGGGSGEIQERAPAWAQELDREDTAWKRKDRAADPAYARRDRSRGAADDAGEDWGVVYNAPEADRDENGGEGAASFRASRAEDKEENGYSAPPYDEEDGYSAPPYDDGDAALDDEDGEGDRRTRVRQAAVRRDRADEAWDREAQRVESSQGRRRPLATDEPEDGEAAQSGKKQKPRKAAKKRTGKSRSEEDERRGFIRTIAIVLVCGTLLLMVALMIVSNFISHPLLALPRKMVSAIVTPAQSFFSGITDGVVDYMRTLKIRGNLEYEYEQLRRQVDENANDLALLEEMRREINALYDQLDEINKYRAMNPVAATVIGHDTANYFSTLTLDVGANDGVADYMAVVSQGGLVGVTYNVQEHTCEVRCIIDSDCTVAGLVETSRDQGSVKGALGATGEAICRMYYLPDSSLPRPGDTVRTSGVGLEFPKGIPIGLIRESTRGMEDNKSYVVVEPIVDFQHLEYVTVYRYRPYYAEEAQERTSTSSNIRIETLTTARPVPTWSAENQSDFLNVPGSVPTATPSGETPGPAATPSPTPGPTATPNPDATARPENLSWDLLGVTPTPSPKPTFTPTPSPVPTPDPGAMTVEDDE